MSNFYFNKIILQYSPPNNFPSQFYHPHKFSTHLSYFKILEKLYLSILSEIKIIIFFNFRNNEKIPALWSMFGKLNNNFKLPKKFTVQLSADYQSKTNLPISTGGQSFSPPSQVQSASQGYIKAFYSVDIAIKKTFLKDAASLTLSVNDIFRSRYSVQYSEGVGFSQNYSRLTNPQMVRLNFSYRFGKMDMSLFKRQNMKGQQEGMQNGMQMQ